MTEFSPEKVLLEAGWKVRPGSSPAVFVAERADDVVYGASVKELLKVVRANGGPKWNSK